VPPRESAARGFAEVGVAKPGRASIAAPPSKGDPCATGHGCWLTKNGSWATTTGFGAKGASSNSSMEPWKSRDEPFFFRDKPWEINGIGGITMLRENGTWRLWYEVIRGRRVQRYIAASLLCRKP